MKRFHVHVGVDDLAGSIRFYSTLFAAEPAVVKPDYAKWMLDEPRLNFAISQRAGGAGIQHLGFQVDSAEELAELSQRLDRAGRPVLEETDVTCCYARSDKRWAADPQGVQWEMFQSHGEGATLESVPAPAARKAAPAVCCPGMAAR